MTKSGQALIKLYRTVGSQCERGRIPIRSINKRHLRQMKQCGSIAVIAAADSRSRVENRQITVLRIDRQQAGGIDRAAAGAAGIVERFLQAVHIRDGVIVRQRGLGVERGLDHLVLHRIDRGAGQSGIHSHALRSGSRNREHVPGNRKRDVISRLKRFHRRSQGGTGGVLRSESRPGQQTARRVNRELVAVDQDFPDFRRPRNLPCRKRNLFVFIEQQIVQIGIGTVAPGFQDRIFMIGIKGIKIGCPGIFGCQLYRAAVLKRPIPVQDQSRAAAGQGDRTRRKI